MSNKSSIGIFFLGLDIKEKALLDRVITFNKIHGLESHSSDSVSSADLVILTDNNFSEVENQTANKSLLIVSNDASCELGNAQITRPLLITHVMKSLEQAIDLAKLNKASKENKATLEEVTITEIKEQKVTDSAEQITDQNTEQVTKPITEPAAKEKITQSGHHALVIDDSAAIRKQLELELRDAGISADFAESGEVALEKITNTQYDLIFLDIIMPGIDGYETCKTMRANEAYKKTPIIMLSGKTSPLDEVQGVIAGATTYLTKPVKSDKLQETLTRVTKWLKNFNTSEKNKTETA